MTQSSIGNVDENPARRQFRASLVAGLLVVGTILVVAGAKQAFFTAIFAPLGGWAFLLIHKSVQGQKLSTDTLTFMAGPTIICLTAVLIGALARMATDVSLAELASTGKVILYVGIAIVLLVCSWELIGIVTEPIQEKRKREE